MFVLFYSKSGNPHLINMDRVLIVSYNNSTDPSEGTVFAFTWGEQDESYLIVRETMEEVQEKITQAHRALKVSFPTEP